MLDDLRANKPGRASGERDHAGAESGRGVCPTDRGEDAHGPAGCRANCVGRFGASV